MRKIITAVLLFAAVCLTAGCGGKTAGTAADAAGPGILPDALTAAGLSEEGMTELSYAEGFAIHELSGGFRLIDLKEDGSRWLVVPEGGQVPEGLPEEMRVLSRPLENIYMAGSAVMSLFGALDALDAVRFSATREHDWYVERAAEAMRRGDLLFAGKYSEPDYEMLLEGGCALAVESTMILHTPEVKEHLERLGIPVLIDRSSYEPHPLGRTEWIRVYGAMLGKEEEADRLFREQAGKAEALEKRAPKPEERKTVVFFYINTAGKPVVRAPEDSIAKMVELGGAGYLFPGKAEASVKKTGSVPLSEEEFLAKAQEADYLIYNAFIDEPLTSVEDLTDKNPMMREFKAVKEGHVWTTDKYLYQAMDRSGDFIADIGRMLDGEEDGLVFLRKVSR